MLRLICLGLLCASLPAVAQVRVCMGGNLDTLSASDRHSCEDQVALARTAAERTHAPEDWHFVVVCGEDGWKDYSAFSAAAEGSLLGAVADTDFPGRTTFLRGTRMLTPQASEAVLRDAFRPLPAGIQIAQR